MDFRKRTAHFGTTVAAACIGAGLMVTTGAIITGLGTGAAVAQDTARAATATQPPPSMAISRRQSWTTVSMSKDELVKIDAAAKIVCCVGVSRSI